MNQRLCSLRYLPQSTVIDRSFLILLAFACSIIASSPALKLSYQYSHAPADCRNWLAVQQKARGQPPLELLVSPAARWLRHRDFWFGTQPHPLTPGLEGASAGSEQREHKSLGMAAQLPTDG